MQLSRFFTLTEMTRSDTATRLAIPNLPDEPALAGLKALCAAVLDPLRDGTGAAIKVNSGYRGPQLNARIGGAKKSQHLEGKAADIQSHGLTVLDLFKAVIRDGLPYDQVIYEAKSRTSKWVHVSHDPDRPGGLRGAILVAEFGADGKVLRYRPISAQQALEMTESATRSFSPEELRYEEMADEPDEFPASARNTIPPEARPEAKANAKAKSKARAKKVTKRKTVAKRKAAAKRQRPKVRKQK